MTKKVAISAVFLRDKVTNEVKYELVGGDDEDSPIVVDMGESWTPTQVVVPLDVLNKVPGGEAIDPRDYTICMTVDHLYEWVFDYVVDANEDELGGLSAGDEVRLYRNYSTEEYTPVTVVEVSGSDTVRVSIPRTGSWEEQLDAAILSSVMGIRYSGNPWHKRSILNRFDQSDNREVSWDILYEDNLTSEKIERNYDTIYTSLKEQHCAFYPTSGD